jgi:hypothetical protein
MVTYIFLIVVSLFVLYKWFYFIRCKRNFISLTDIDNQFLTRLNEHDNQES